MTIGLHTASVSTDAEWTMTSSKSCTWTWAAAWAPRDPRLAAMTRGLSWCRLHLPEASPHLATLRGTRQSLIPCLSTLTAMARATAVIAIAHRAHHLHHSKR